MVAPWTPAEGEGLAEPRPRSCLLFLSEVRGSFSLFVSPPAQMVNYPREEERRSRRKPEGLLLLPLLLLLLLLLDGRPAVRTRESFHFSFLNRSLLYLCEDVRFQQTASREESRKASWEEREAFSIGGGEGGSNATAVALTGPVT